MSYNRTLARYSFSTMVVIDIALAHLLVWLSTVGEKSEGLWFKFGSIWAMICIILTVASGIWLIEKSGKR